MKRVLANWELKVLAVVAAVVVWTLVVGAENSFYTLPDDVQIKAFNVPENLVVVDDLGKAKLRLKVNSTDNIKNINPDDFTAFVDLEGFKEGERDAPIEVTSKNSDVTVLKVEPSSVTVRIEEKSEKEVPIVYEIEGNPKEGYQVKEVVVDAEKVILKGSQKILNDVDFATLLIILEGEENDIKKTYPLMVLDDEGEEISTITSALKEVEVEIEISLITSQKIVGIQPDIKGTVPENSWIKSIQVDPSFVTLSGDAEALKEIEFVKTESINVDGLTESNSYKVFVSGMPEGVEVEGDSSVTVSIEVESLDPGDTSLKKKTINVPISVTKFRTDQENRRISPPSVTVVLEGKQNAIDKVSSNYKIELDISPYDDNDAVIQIDNSLLDLPNGVSLMNVIPSKVTISW